MSRICKPVIGVGPIIGESQLVPDSRICLPHISVGPQNGSLTPISLPIGVLFNPATGQPLINPATGLPLLNPGS